MRRQRRIEMGSLRLIALLLAGLDAFGQSAAGTSGTKTKLPQFEVASIKLSHTDQERGVIQVPPGGDRVIVVNAPMYRILGFAFGLQRGDLVLGVPEWTRTDRWDIEAKISAADLTAFHALTFKEQESMLQPLLVERCRMQAHMEEKTVPVYALVVGSGGVKMHAVKAKDQAWDLTQKRGEVHGRAVPMEALIYALSNAALDRQVVNQTRLVGTYDFDLVWTPGDETAADSPAEGARPAMFTAMQEQLGLKLVTVKAKVPALMVVHIERPTAN